MTAARWDDHRVNKIVLINQLGYLADTEIAQQLSIKGCFDIPEDKINNTTALILEEIGRISVHQDYTELISLTT